MILNNIILQRLFFITIALSGLMPVIAQINQNSTANKNDTIYDKRFAEKLVAKVFINPIPSNNIQYYKDWADGEVYLTSGNIVKNELLRYNCFLDELLWARKTDFQIGVVYRSTVSEFVLYEKDSNKRLIFRNIRLKNSLLNDSVNSYLQVLVEGELTLFAKRKAKKISSFNDLVRNDEYYILYHGSFIKLKPNRYSLYRLMNETDKPRMKSSVRSAHLKVRFEPQLMRAIEIFNAGAKVKIK